MQSLPAVLLICICLLCAALVTWAWWHFIGRGMAKERARREHLTLVLNPVYRAKVEEDRRYQLALANLALQRERLYLGGRKVSEGSPAQIAAPGDALPVPTFADLLEEGAIGRGVRLLLGYREGAPRYGTWLDLYSCAIAGLQGSGKTTTELFIILQSVLAGALLLIIDPHRDTAQDSLGGRLAPLASCFMRPIAGDDDRAILAIIKTARKEVERRRRGGTGSPVILVIDEFTKLMRRSPEIKDELAARIEEIAQEGRKMHVFSLLSGQISKAGASGGTELRYSLASSFVHRIQEQQSKLSPRLKPGGVLFYDTGGDTALMQIPYTTEQDVVTVAGMIATSPADFKAASPRLPDTPGEVTTIHPLKLLTKPH
jgi:hypothetical protein